MAIFDEFNIPPCIWFSENKRNALASMISGFFFFAGWWFLIDAASVYPKEVAHSYHICGIVGTVSFIMVNSVSNALLTGDAYEGGIMGPRGARFWLFFGFVLGFASVIAACWILFADFVASDVKQWPGVALFMQNALIFIASLVFKFGRVEENF